MAHHAHSPGFLKLVDDAKARIRQITIDQYRELSDRHDPHVLIDVREDNEWDRGHLPGAIHLSKGTIERDIERNFGANTPIVCYCGGGYRSALVCDNLRRMGYTNVISMDGGFRGWVAKGLPVEKG